jgi:formylglycine-generating enzyme required for sulfatase activity
MGCGEVQIYELAESIAKDLRTYLETGKKPEQPQQPPPPPVTPPSVSPTPSPPLPGTPPSTPSQGYGAIKITTNPAGATVFVDATPMGTTPTTLTNIPAGERQLSIVKDGYSTLNKVVTVYAGRTTEVTETLARLTGSIMIGSSPSGAQVYLNDKYVGTTPYKVQNIPIGKYSVRVVLQDYKEYRGEVSVEANEESKVDAKLEGLPGKVLITSTPAGAEVSIDGKKVGVTPYSGEVSAGAHKVRVWKEGYQSAEESITIEPNRAKTLDVVLKKGPDVRGEMVYVPAGEFMMGCNKAVDKKCDPDEKPYHKVYLNAYYIDKYEVTVAQYTECVNAGKCTPGNSGDFCNYGREDRQNHPINCVDWNQAKAYCEWLGKRLPTEAEWEKAARGTDGRVYPWGNEWNPRNANWDERGREDGYKETAPVGSYGGGVSPYGAYDMSGNVWEWVADWYGERYYRNSPSSNPRGPASGQYRVVRGGGWFGDYPDYLRASVRDWGGPGTRNLYVGFRCSRD